MRRLFNILLILSTLFGQLGDITSVAYGQITATPAQLKKINEQISQLNKTLAAAHDKQGLLNTELSNTERKIGLGVEELRTMQSTMHNKEQIIAHLNTEIDNLNKQRKQQQQLLAHHLQARYKMGNNQPLKWLITQQDPDQINRLLTYYHYIIRSRQQLITQIESTQTKLTLQQHQLHAQLINQQQLHSKLMQQQHTLNQQKQYHNALIHSLNQEIQTNQHTLHEYERNKNNLAQLLVSLTPNEAPPKKVHYPISPFAAMHKKLPYPLQIKPESFKRMNQGVTFFADEGVTVTAVYPGTVVFSDWLKGYGLLLIIDHGQGFMTLYAHNQSLFKHKGQNVTQHEAIASVGHSGGLQQNGLYFEVRRYGKAVSPLEWLA